MKKIVSAVALAAVAASLATAEVKVSVNARVRGDLVEVSSGKADSEKVLLSNSTNDANSIVSASAADTLTVEAKEDYAGVKFAFSNDMSKGSTGVDNYNAWLKFGDLKLRGSYNSGNRTANRVTTDQNNVSLLEGNLTAAGRISVASNLGAANEKWAWAKGTLANSGKLGINKNLASIFENSKVLSVGADIDNMDVNIAGTKKLAWGAEYAVKEVLPGDLTVMAYVLESSKESQTKNDDGNVVTTLNAQSAYKLDYLQKDTVRVTFDAKLAHKAMAFGLFASPLMVENLQLTVGGTYAVDKAGSSKVNKEKDISYWGVDFRTRYALSEAMAATLYANASGVSYDEDSALALDFIGNFTYGLNDKVKLFVEGEYAAISLDKDNEEKNNVYATSSTTYSLKSSDGTINSSTTSTYLIGSSVTGQVGAVLTAGKGATLTTALRMTVSGLGIDKDKTGYAQSTLVSLPVVMRVQL